MAVHSLNALVGNINMPGGVLVCDPPPLNPLPQFQKDAIASKGLKKPRLDQAGSRRYPFSKSLIGDFSETIIKSAKSPVDTLLVFSANPAFTLPDGGAFRTALKKIPFIVSFSPYRDETSYMADLILPDHMYLEKKDDLVWPNGLQYPLYGISKPVVKPVYATRNSGNVIIQLAKRIGGSVASAFPWKRYEDVLKQRAKGLFDAQGGGQVHYDHSVPVWERLQKRESVTPDYKTFEDMWKKIKAGGFWYLPVHTHKNWERVFKTSTGKFEFFSTHTERAFYDYSLKVSEETARKNMGIAEKGDAVFMPHYEPAPSDVDRSEYPLVMMPYEMINLASGWIPNPPYLYKTLFDHQLRKDDSFAEINPKTASKYGFKDGDPAIIKSPTGSVRVRVNLFEGAMPGIVYLPLGFGHTAYDEFSVGKGINPNDIIHGGKDPLSGHPMWWNTPVQLIKV